jgi:hypothetical protein
MRVPYRGLPAPALNRFSRCDLRLFVNKRMLLSCYRCHSHVALTWGGLCACQCYSNGEWRGWCGQPADPSSDFPPTTTPETWLLTPCLTLARAPL